MAKSIEVGRPLHTDGKAALGLLGRRKLSKKSVTKELHSTLGYEGNSGVDLVGGSECSFQIDAEWAFGVVVEE